MNCSCCEWVHMQQRREVTFSVSMPHDTLSTSLHVQYCMHFSDNLHIHICDFTMKHKLERGTNIKFCVRLQKLATETLHKHDPWICQRNWAHCVRIIGLSWLLPLLKREWHSKHLIGLIYCCRLVDDFESLCYRFPKFDTEFYVCSLRKITNVQEHIVTKMWHISKSCWNDVTLEYWLTKVTARSCYTLITVLRYIYLQ